MINFIVQGTPRSQQARPRAQMQWKEDVRHAAPSQNAISPDPIRLRIDFFFNGVTDLDTDNIIKPIQDALEETLYEDDSVVVDVCSRKVNLARLPPLINPPDKLLRELSTNRGKDFVLVRVDGAYSEVDFR